MYHTRFVFQIPLEAANEIAGCVAHVIKASGQGPISVNLNVDEEDKLAVATITYSTQTPAESDAIIAAWRGIRPSVQVERTHKLDAARFTNFALSQPENKPLRNFLALEVERLCRRGVGSTGILDYLRESEAVVTELKEFVESMRAPV